MGCHYSPRSHRNNERRASLIRGNPQLLCVYLAASLFPTTGPALATNCREEKTVLKVAIDGVVQEAQPGELLIDLINRTGGSVPHVCYHPQLGPVQTCDTCMVEENGRLVRACAISVADGMSIFTKSATASAAQVEAFDRILSNHLLYCTVCDNNNGNCTVHNTTKLLAIEHQRIPFRSKPYEVDNTNPFYRYDPDQCILCGRCVEACQNVEVNETLSINWEDPNPRVLWDGGSTIGESSCVSCGHCVTVCPCNALMEKTMLGHAGFFTSLKKSTLSGMIEVVKGVEPETGYGTILQVSEAEEAMREHRIRKTKTVCTYCGVGCSFDVWTKDRHILKVAPEHGPTNGISTCVKGKFGWDFINSPDRLTRPLIREGDKFREASWDEALQLIARRSSSPTSASTRWRDVPTCSFARDQAPISCGCRPSAVICSTRAWPKANSSTPGSTDWMNIKRV